MADTPRQTGRAAQLKAEAAERLKIIDQTLAEARRGEKAAAVSIIREGSGKAVMDRIRVLAADMEREEAALLDRRTAEDQASGDLLRNTLLAAAVVAVAVGLMLFLAFRRFALALATSNQALSAKNVQIEGEIHA